MHTLAKRVYNVSPDPVRLSFEDGETVTVQMRSAEFFQESFQAEGSVDGTTYRLVTDGEDDPLLCARETDDGWAVVGEVVEVAPA